MTRIAYLTTAYPKLSHAFIRREILGVERSGLHVTRLSIRPSDEEPANLEDESELKKTFACLKESPVRILGANIRLAVRHPCKYMVAAWKSIRCGMLSDRGLVRHLAYLAEAAVLLGVLRKERCQHVHVHFGTNATFVAMLIRELGGPTFSFTVHGPAEFDAPVALAIPETVKRALFVVAITSFCRAQLQRWSDVSDWHRIKVLRSGVPEEFFSSATPTPDVPELLTIGRLSAQKGHITLLDAIRRVVDREVAVRLVVAGDGELRNTLVAEVDRLNLAGVVEFIGAVSERQVRERIASSRGLVMASYAEGLPGVIMEAMAMQRAVVATAVNGIPELVFPGRNGWLAPAGDPAALSDAIVEMLRLPIDELRTMGRAAQEDARNRHHLNTTIEGMTSLFERYVTNDV